MAAKKNNILEFIRTKYIGTDQESLALLAQERKKAEVARQVYDARKRAGLNQKQLAELVGTTQSVISRLEDADYGGHSVKMLVRIANALGQQLKVSIVDERLVVERPEEEQRAERAVIQHLVDRSPAPEMVRRGWIEGDTLEEMRVTVAAFLGVRPRTAPAFFRRSKASKADEAAMICWLTKVEIEASREDVGDFSAERVQRQVTALARLSAREDGPVRAVRWLAARGVRCVFVRHLGKTYLDGAAMLLDDAKPAVALTLRHDRIDSFWFTLLHEIGHLVKHQDRLATEPILDERIDLRSEDATEEQANEFARTAWVSDKQWQEFRRSAGPIPSKVRIRNFAARLGVAPALAAGRLQFEMGRYQFYRGLIGQDQVQKIISREFRIH